MDSLADVIVAQVPDVDRENAQKFMRELLIAILAGAIVEAGKETAHHEATWQNEW